MTAKKPKTPPSSRHEGRVRVVFNLPHGRKQESGAVQGVIAYLQSLRSEATGLSGFTHSQVFPAVYHGYWWDEENNQWVPDRLILFTLDFLADTSEQSLAIPGLLEELKAKIAQIYRHHKSKQDEVWMVSFKVERER